MEMKKAACAVLFAAASMSAVMAEVATPAPAPAPTATSDASASLPVVLSIVVVFSSRSSPNAAIPLRFLPLFSSLVNPKTLYTLSALTLISVSQLSLQPNPITFAHSQNKKHITPNLNFVRSFSSFCTKSNVRDFNCSSIERTRTQVQDILGQKSRNADLDLIRSYASLSTNSNSPCSKWISEQGPRYLSTSSTKADKTLNTSEYPSQNPDFKHQEIEGPAVERDLSALANETREVLEGMMKNIYGLS
ncbi:hypothetical protein CRYUN_Cryun14cG0002600 [Craigia yunnanensis]